MGIAASPVLISTSCRDNITSYLPSPQVFNHAIVQVMLNGTAYWVDPTITCQGGSLKSSQVASITGLVICPQTVGLIHHKHTPSNSIEAISNYRVDHITDMYLDVDLVVHDRVADHFRRRLEYLGKTEFLKPFEEDFRRYYGRINISKTLAVNDNRCENSLALKWSMRLYDPYEKTEKQHICHLYPFIIIDHLPSEIDDQRKTPYGIPFGVSKYSHVVQITFSNQPVDVVPRSFEIKSGYLDFNFELGRQNSHSWRSVFTLSYLQKSVAVEDIPEFASHIKQCFFCCLNHATSTGLNPSLWNRVKRWLKGIS